LVLVYLTLVFFSALISFIIESFAVGNKSGYTTIQSKERIVLMETKSPASTNGDTQFLLPQVDETMMISLPAHAWLTGYVGEEASFDQIQVELNLRTQQLTHPSATAGYAVFRQNCQVQGIPPLSFANWVRSATLRAQAEHDRSKESGVMIPLGSTTTL
jgi:hypothetical protein